MLNKHAQKIIRLVDFSIDDLGKYLITQEERTELATHLEAKAKEYRAPRVVLDVESEVTTSGT